MYGTSIPTEYGQTKFISAKTATPQSLISDLSEFILLSMVVNLYSVQTAK